MGWRSTWADIEDKAADSRFLGNLFSNGSAGAAGVGRPERQPHPAAYVIVRARQEEEKARKVEAQTRRLVDNQLAWREATAGVVPLRRK